MSAFQGFAFKNNLLEATADRQIFTNLGGSPLGDDITLLFNNKRNISSLTVNVSNIAINGYIRFTESETRAVFSNNTKIRLGNTIYYVRDSDGVSEFRLSTTEDLMTPALPFVGVYVRSDEVTLEHISNFSTIRRSTDVNAVQTETLTGFLNQSASILGNTSSTELLLSTENNLDFYKFKKAKAIVRNTNFLSNRLVKINGVVTISDIDNLNISGLTNQKPGLFIYNPSTSSGIRAFSSNDNPWLESQVAPFLETTTNQITIGVLRNATWNTGVTYDPRSFSISLKNSTMFETVVETAIVAKSNFTHKTEMLINGETYSLCLAVD